MEPNHRRVLLLAIPVVLTATVLFTLHLATEKRDRILVEVINAGPVGGSPSSQGYMWVQPESLAPVGTIWQPVDLKSLTPEQRKRIR